MFAALRQWFPTPHHETHPGYLGQHLQTNIPHCIEDLHLPTLSIVHHLVCQVPELIRITGDTCDPVPNQ